MLVTFFSKTFLVVKHEFFPVGQTVESAFDIKIPKHLAAKKFSGKGRKCKESIGSCAMTTRIVTLTT
jgi:hypothetical protein